MKLSRTLLAAAVLACSTTAAFAQSTTGLTRAQVKSDLVRLEKAGYNPESDRITYPTGIQAAEARVAAQDGMKRPQYVKAGDGSATNMQTPFEQH